MNPAIITITPCPAVDHTFLLERLETRRVNRADTALMRAGGKGLNVSTMLARYGMATTATGFIGEENAGIFEVACRDTGIGEHFIRVPGRTRAGIKIVDQSRGETTDINSAGPPVTRAHFESLLGEIAALAAPGSWFVIGGSLPPGFSEEWLVELIGVIRAGGGLVAVDASGAALRAAVNAGADLIKPNHYELAELCDVPDDDPSALHAAAVRLQESGIARVIVSLGENGAWFLCPQARLHAAAPPAKVVSTVGAGDSLLAGYLAGLAEDLPPEQRARLATVFAWCAVETPELALPAAPEIERRSSMVRLTEW